MSHVRREGVDRVTPTHVVAAARPTLSGAAQLVRRAVLVAALTMGTGTVPAWRLSLQPPPAQVLPVGDPVTPIDRPR